MDILLFHLRIHLTTLYREGKAAFGSVRNLQKQTDTQEQMLSFSRIRKTLSLSTRKLYVDTKDFQFTHAM